MTYRIDSLHSGVIAEYRRVYIAPEYVKARSSLFDFCWSMLRCPVLMCCPRTLLRTLLMWIRLWAQGYTTGDAYHNVAVNVRKLRSITRREARRAAALVHSLTAKPVVCLHYPPQWKHLLGDRFSSVFPPDITYPQPTTISSFRKLITLTQ